MRARRRLLIDMESMRVVADRECLDVPRAVKRVAAELSALRQGAKFFEEVSDRDLAERGSARANIMLGARVMTQVPVVVSNSKETNRKNRRSGRLWGCLLSMNASRAREGIARTHPARASGILFDAGTPSDEELSTKPTAHHPHYDRAVCNGCATDPDSVARAASSSRCIGCDQIRRQTPYFQN